MARPKSTKVVVVWPRERVDGFMETMLDLSTRDDGMVPIADLETRCKAFFKLNNRATATIFMVDLDGNRASRTSLIVQMALDGLTVQQMATSLGFDYASIYAVVKSKKIEVSSQRGFQTPDELMASVVAWQNHNEREWRKLEPEDLVDKTLKNPDGVGTFEGQDEETDIESEAA